MAFAFQSSDRYFDESGTDKVLVNSFSDIGYSSRVGNDLVVNLTTGSFTIIDHFAGHAIENIVAGGQIVVLATGTMGGNTPGIIIAGSNKSETFDGRGGDDFLHGNGGHDRLIGGEGNDRLAGGKGINRTHARTRLLRCTFLISRICSRFGDRNISPSGKTACEKRDCRSNCQSNAGQHSG